MCNLPLGRSSVVGNRAEFIYMMIGNDRPSNWKLSYRSNILSFGSHTHTHTHTSDSLSSLSLFFFFSFYLRLSFHLDHGKSFGAVIAGKSWDKWTRSPPCKLNRHVDGIRDMIDLVMVS